MPLLAPLTAVAAGSASSQLKGCVLRVLFLVGRRCLFAGEQIFFLTNAMRSVAYHVTEHLGKSCLLASEIKDASIECQMILTRMRYWRNLKHSTGENDRHGHAVTRQIVVIQRYMLQEKIPRRTTLPQAANACSSCRIGDNTKQRDRTVHVLDVVAINGGSFLLHGNWLQISSVRRFGERKRIASGLRVCLCHILG